MLTQRVRKESGLFSDPEDKRPTADEDELLRVSSIQLDYANPPETVRTKLSDFASSQATKTMHIRQGKK
jgi:hypothetical protein